jgi:hypothetical protein
LAKEIRDAFPEFHLSENQRHAAHGFSRTAYITQGEKSCEVAMSNTPGRNPTDAESQFLVA